MSHGRRENCAACGAPVEPRAEVCSHCGRWYRSGLPLDPVATTASKRTVAGICALFFGGLGIHKFILGITTPAIIMLVFTVATCGIGGLITGLIGMIEGIIYLTKTDQEFEEMYLRGKKPWF